MAQGHKRVAENATVVGCGLDTGEWNILYFDNFVETLLRKNFRMNLDETCNHIDYKSE